ncbi:APC family permease [Nonomuraea lactucae]|uniref:APC family permease n=1 Tax=Nonomuraea lactucae TaxID=2249762 RepID=UPI000DE4BE72|nr:APC family permease [Nonomuraea lactucae]
MSLHDQPVAEPVRTGGLRKGTIGVFGMAFMVIAATAPLTAMASNMSLSLGLGVGAGSVGLLVLTGALLAVFAVGYVVLTRYVTNAGAYYAFIGFGLGRSSGAAAAFIATLAYNLAAGGMIVATGYFLDITVTSYLDVDLPWYAYGAVALVITFFLGLRGVELAQRVTTVISVAQFGIILLLGLAIVVQRPGGWSLSVLSPGEMFGGNVAMTLVFCLLCFGGFEAAAVYGEEAHAPRRAIKIATYLGLGLLLVAFVFSTWSLAAAFADVRTVAAEDPGSLIFRTADLYLGDWSGPLFSALVAFSFLAAAVAFHNISTRYLFSLGRAGLLPGFLARVHHRHGTPYLSTYAQTVFTLVMLVPFAASGLDPIMHLFPAASGITSLSMLALMLGCCASVIAAAFRGKVTERWWETVLAPGIAGIGVLVTMGIVVVNYQALTGSDSIVVAFMPVIPVLAALYGVLVSRRKGEVSLDDVAGG